MRVITSAGLRQAGSTRVSNESVQNDPDPFGRWRVTARTIGTAVVVVGGGAALVVRQLRRRASARGRATTGPRSRWRAVTINRTPEEVMHGGPPASLAELGDLVEVEVRPAPAERGSELRARLRTHEPTGSASAAARISGRDPHQRMRAALREAKQLIEVGEVLRVDPAPHGRRTATLTGALVERATDLAPGEGLL